MDIRLKLERPRVVKLSSGQSGRTVWEPAGSCWAEKPLSKAQLVVDAAEYFEAHSATFRVRWGVKIMQGWRVIDPDGIKYSVDTLQKFRRSGIIELNCTQTNE